MSDAARAVYRETGDLTQAIAASEARYAELVSQLGSPEAVAQAHARLGTDFTPLYGPRHFISFTTNESTAVYFSQGGAIFEAQVPRSLIFEQTLPGATESEQLILHMTNAVRR